MLAGGRVTSVPDCCPGCLQSSSCQTSRRQASGCPPAHRLAAGVRQRNSAALTARAQAQTQNKEFRPPRWEFVFGDLTDKRDLQTLSAREAWEQVEKGKLVLVDVRPAARFEEAHPPGAKSAPLYRKTDFSQFSFQRWFKAAALMANGIEPVEPNPTFLSDLKAASGGKPIVVMCETGGSLQASPSFPTGKVSRSLLAAYQAFELGNFQSGDVYHLKGGAYGWSRAGLPMDGEYTSSGTGRTPNVVGEEEEAAVSTIRDVQSE